MHTHPAEEHIPDDIQPRQLIIAIQSNLGITKKEISERTGISYGTLNRYTRNPPAGGRPRPSSMKKLINLYRISCKRYGTANDHPDHEAEADDSAAAKPGEAYRRVLLGMTAQPHAADPASSPRPAAGPLDEFMTKVALYARDDLRAFETSGFRDRARLEESRALVGDAYLALLHAMSAEAFARQLEAPDTSSPVSADAASTEVAIASDPGARDAMDRHVGPSGAGSFEASGGDGSRPV